ncbi:MAG: isocitrate/isopropylmalate dehydrogenase family protein [Proteocatella sp.]
MQKITLINGDGIGPEVIDSAVRIINSFNLPIEWDLFNAGKEYFEKTGMLLQDGLLENIAQNKIVLKGPTETPVGSGFRSINVLLRKEFETYANVRPIKSIDGVETRYKDLDLVIVRENTEDLYSGIEYMASKDVAQSIKIISRDASERICKYAFELAKNDGRKKVTVVHKANIMKLTDGLFLDSFRKISKSYPDIVADEKIVDNMCMQLVINPNQFDVIVAPNLYGDIISDLCSGLVGGLGLASSANIGDNVQIYEAVHGSAPDIAGQDISNPTAVILSAAMMLSDIGYKKEAARIKAAVLKTLADSNFHTKDLGGSSDRIRYTNAVISNL